MQKQIITIIALCLFIQSQAQVTKTYQYDQTNQLTQVLYSNGFKQVYNYDELGNRTSQINTITGIAPIKLSENCLNISPNPTNNSVLVSITNNMETEITKASLLDINGKELQYFDIPKTVNQFSVDLSQFGAGIYFLTFYSAKGKLSKKVVKQ